MQTSLSFFLLFKTLKPTPCAKWFQETVRLSTVMNCLHSFYAETICFWIKVSPSYWFLEALLKLFFAINVSESYDFYEEKNGNMNLRSPKTTIFRENVH